MVAFEILAIDTRSSFEGRCKAAVKDEQALSRQSSLKGPPIWMTLS